MAVCDDPLGERDADAETLLSVWVAILQEVVADFLICKRFVGLDNVHPSVVDEVLCDVVRQIFASLVRMVGFRKLSVMGSNLFVRGRLYPR